jgi:uncharacterized membrane protein SpoIIM required for sporulation
LREGLFIKKNKARWEEIQEGTATDPDEIARSFTQLVDDLAYAKTFYPTSRVTRYINSLASRIFLNIYKSRRDRSNRVARFWKHDVPATMYRHRMTLLFSLFVFIVFFAVGFFSAEKEPGFVREILGDAYVDMTERNIENDNPFGVYGNENSLYMFVRIMLNNITVAFTSFFQGILLGIPSMHILMKNSIMVGVFEQMFFDRGLGGKAVVTILIHGLLELTAIIIACGAGLIMGKSILFPGTVKRLAAFRNGARDGLKLVVSLVPVFVVAALLESYVTRYYEMALVFSLTILAVCLAFVLWYYVWCAYKVGRELNSGSVADV